jgi:nicotinate (nicotinamide) nucleotide adenylyltransferase
MRLAFFGAFNPPTTAHLDLARFAMEKTEAEQVIFVPSRAVYICRDQGKDFAYQDEERLAMLRKAAESRPWMTVTDWEMKQERQPRTYETLCHLREEGRGATLLMGSDKLPELEKGWLHVEEIVREFGIVCLTRGRDECRRMLRENPYLNPLSDGIRVLETPEDTRGISSTEVRRRIREIRRLEEELAGMIPPEIRPML